MKSDGTRHPQIRQPDMNHSETSSTPGPQGTDEESNGSYMWHDDGAMGDLTPNLGPDSPVDAEIRNHDDSGSETGGGYFSHKDIREPESHTSLDEGLDREDRGGRETQRNATGSKETKGQESMSKEVRDHKTGGQQTWPTNSPPMGCPASDQAAIDASAQQNPRREALSQKLVDRFREETIQEFGEAVFDDYWEDFMREQEEKKGRLLPDARAIKEGPRKDSEESPKDHSTGRFGEGSWEESLRPLGEGFKPGSLDDPDSWSWASKQNNRMATASDASSPPSAASWSPPSKHSSGLPWTRDLLWSGRQSTLASVCRVSSEKTVPVEIETGLGDVYEGAGTADLYPSCHKPSSCADWKRPSDHGDPAPTTPRNKSRDTFISNNRSSALAFSIRDSGVHTMGIEDIRLENNRSDIRVQSPTSDKQQLRAKEDSPTPEDEEPEQWLTPPQTPKSTENGGCDPPSANLVQSTARKPSALEKASAAAEVLQAHEDAPHEAQPSKKEILAEQGPERRPVNELLSEAEASDRGQLRERERGLDQLAAAEETLPTARRLVPKQSIADADGTGSLLRVIVADHFNAWLDLLNLLHAAYERLYVWSNVSYQRLRHVGDAENTPEMPACPPIVLGSRVSGYILMMHAMLMIHLYVLSGLQRERLIWMMANRRTREYLLERIARFGGGRQQVWADWSCGRW
jgi:hypothetical protein